MLEFGIFLIFRLQLLLSLIICFNQQTQKKHQTDLTPFLVVNFNIVVASRSQAFF